MTSKSGIDAKIDVFVASSPEERRSIQSFRYRILADKLGRVGRDTDPTRKMVASPEDDHALHLALTWNGRIAATVRITSGALPDIPEGLRRGMQMHRFAAISGIQVSVTDMLVTDPEVPDGRIARLLLSAAYKMALARKSIFDFTHVAPSDVSMMQRLGYRSHGSTFDDADGGIRVPMVLPTADLQHMADVQSPFRGIAQKAKLNQQSVVWFRKNFPDAVESVQPATMDEDSFWSMLTRKLNQVPHHGVPLLNGLTFREACDFMRLATVIEAAEGRRIIAKGDMGNEMYVLLSGEVEVRNGEQRLARFARGAVFGEMAFLSTEPRTADVVAAEPSEVLVLNQSMVRKAMDTMPTVAAQVMLNLSLILVERLRDTTGRVILQSAQPAA